MAPRPDLEDKPENYFTMTYILNRDEGATTLQTDPFATSYQPVFLHNAGDLDHGDVRRHSGSMKYELAQVNIARLVAPLDDPDLADFVRALDPVNAVADAAAGFVWRLQTEEGNATAIRAFEWDATGSAGVIVNMSVWASVEDLAAFVYGEEHRQVLRRRREWFQRMTDAHMACWWVPAGHRPTIAEAEGRVLHLREHGPTSHAFTLRHHYPSPDNDAEEAIRGPHEWLCPA